MEVLQSESLGMPEAVLRFGHPFTHEVVWQMTIHTGGCSVMTGFLPALILLTHDVAVDARFRIAAKVGEPFTVVDGVEARAGADSYQSPDQCGSNAAPRSTTHFME